MKVIVDDKIPYIREAAARLFDEVVYLPGAEFGKSTELRDADALIIRTRTKCTRQLLEGTNVRFIATATIGFDHINVDDVKALGIEWTNCPGCNASSVGQYVRNCLILTSAQSGKSMADYCVGIVGYGHVGREVYKALETMGCRILVNDPPLEAQGGADVPLVSLSQLARDCNVITFHTPLTREGECPTFHMAGAEFFKSLQSKPIIINAARGGVVDEVAMLEAKAAGLTSNLIIDTWEHEPDIDDRLLNEALIATPHIAGYSADGKSNATRMALRATCAYFNIGIEDEAAFLQQTAPPLLPASLLPTGDMLRDHLLLYNPLEDTKRLRQAPALFEYQRGNYPLRREQFG